MSNPKYKIVPFSQTKGYTPFRYQEKWWMKSDAGLTSFECTERGEINAFGLIKFLAAEELVGVEK